MSHETLPRRSPRVGDGNHLDVGELAPVHFPERLKLYPNEHQLWDVYDSIAKQLPGVLVRFTSAQP